MTKYNEDDIFLISELRKEGFFKEQLENWKLKVGLVLLAIVILGLVGHILR